MHQKLTAPFNLISKIFIVLDWGLQAWFLEISEYCICSLRILFTCFSFKSCILKLRVNVHSLTRVYNILVHTYVENNQLSSLVTMKTGHILYFKELFGRVLTRLN